VEYVYASFFDIDIKPKSIYIYLSVCVSSFFYYMSSFIAFQTDFYILIGMVAFASALCYLSYHSRASKLNVKHPTSNLRLTSTTRIDHSCRNSSNKQVQLGGGSNVKPNPSRLPSESIKIGEYTVLDTVTVTTNLTIQNDWRPPRLPTLKSNHPLVVYLTPQLEGKIRLAGKNQITY
jgi:hypothetical protein